ncbi:MAG: helix-turn-helix domain-containing protein [Oscillospiraceae bacterium]|nr:helix-turn-helix domain-containing protein [Oscillospiraceae bacterium]
MDIEENAHPEEKMPSEELVVEAANSLTEWQIFTERLRSAREKAGLTVQALAEKLSVDISTVSRWESGTREPGLKMVADIAEKLDVPTDYLLGLTDSDGSSQSLTINDRAKAILERVRDKSDEQALFFETTFTRYIEQISLLKKLKKAIDDNGVLIAKVNVKGDENQISNPALKDYVSVSAQANDTGKLLIRFVQDPLEGDSDKDELELFLAGR